MGLLHSINQYLWDTYSPRDHPCLPRASLLEEGEDRGKIADLINKRIVRSLEEEKIARRRKSGED